MSPAQLALLALKIAAYFFFGLVIYALVMAPALAAALLKTPPLNVFVYGLLCLVAWNFVTDVLRLKIFGTKE